jgi:hypothetical protein
MSSVYYFLYVVNSLQQLQQWHQMTIRKMPHRTSQGKNRQWQIYSKMFKRLPSSLTHCYSKCDYGRILSMHSLEGTVWSDGYNLIRTVFLEQVRSAAMRCLASLLQSHTATNRSQGKLPMTSETGSTITF